MFTYSKGHDSVLVHLNSLYFDMQDANLVSTIAVLRLESFVTVIKMTIRGVFMKVTLLINKDCH